MAKTKQSTKTSAKSVGKPSAKAKAGGAAKAAKAVKAKQPPPKSKQPPKLDPENAQVPGEIDIWTSGGVVTEELPMRNPLTAQTPFAVRFKVDRDRPHLYVVHKEPTTKVVTPLLYTMATAGREMRLPLPESWLWSQDIGFIIVVTSPKRLTREQLAKLLKGRAPKPVIIGDKDMVIAPVMA